MVYSEHPSPAPSLAVEKKLTLSSSATGGAALLISLQVGSRAITFLVNQILLRYLSPELLGISTQLEVYLITVLFFGRESLRVAIQRQADTLDDGVGCNGEKTPNGHVDARTAAGRTQAIVNLAYISILLGAALSFAVAWAYMRSLSAGDPTVLEIPYFRGALKLYGLAAFWEILSEPCFIVVQQKSLFKIRTYAELLATLLRCVVTTGSAVCASRLGLDIGVLPFAVGQGAYAATLVFVYYMSVWSISTDGGFSLMPMPIYSM